MLSLLIDDMRNIDVDVIARNGEAGLKLLGYNIWSALYIDHDLGDGINGYQVITRMLENEKIVLPTYVMIVSSNPVGRENIGRALEYSGYTRKTPSEFVLI